MTAKTRLSKKEYSRQVERISKRIEPMLKGLHPVVQSGVLANLLSLCLAGIWPPDFRESMLEEHLALVRDLVPESEQELFGDAGHPAGRVQ
jgi:hypothetical protein